LEALVFETDVEDYLEEDGVFKIITIPENFSIVKNFFTAKNIELTFADLDYIPNTEMEVTDFDSALKLTKMLEGFREDEDVEKITVNMVISPELQKEVNEFIEKNTFRT
jgi:transcriptional/translational regulatory protein YebC/TACO1